MVEATAINCRLLREGSITLLKAKARSPTRALGDDENDTVIFRNKLGSAGYLTVSSKYPFGNIYIPKCEAWMPSKGCFRDEGSARLRRRYKF